MNEARSVSIVVCYGATSRAAIRARERRIGRSIDPWGAEFNHVHPWVSDGVTRITRPRTYEAERLGLRDSMVQSVPALGAVAGVVRSVEPIDRSIDRSLDGSTSRHSLRGLARTHKWGHPARDSTHRLRVAATEGAHED